MRFIGCCWMFFLTIFFPVLGVTSTDIIHRPVKIIGISQIVEHPALDAVRLGLLEALREHGFVPGENLKVSYENAQGNLVTSTQIATQLLSRPADVLIGISTPSAQTLLNTAKRHHTQIPIVFSAVSDPHLAKLDPEQSDYPITGITDSPNLEVLLTLMQKLLPHLKTVGLLYNPSEANSVSTITQFKKLLESQDIAVREVTVNTTSAVAEAMQSLLGKVDALYFPQDNTVVSAIETVVNLANKATAHHPALPLFCSDPLLVKRGVLAAVGYDYTEVGRETGEVVAKLLQGEDIKNIPVHSPAKLETVVNQALAQQLGLV